MSWASASGSPGAPRAAARRGTGGALVRHLVVTLLAVVGGSLVVSVLSFFIAGPAGSTATFAIVSTALGLAVLACLTRWRVVAGLRAGIPALPWTAAGCAVAYVVAPASWGGTALFWWQLVGPGPLAFALDLPVWVAVVGLGVLWGTSQQRLVTGPATPYG